MTKKIFQLVAIVCVLSLIVEAGRKRTIEKSKFIQFVSHLR